MATAIQPTARQERKTALDHIRAYAENDEVKKRFINLLGEEEGKAYLESVVIAVAREESLQKCTPKSIMIQAMRAASLKLSVDPIMEQAHLVAFGDQATLIPDYHGLVQMSVNTNYYEIAPHVSEVFEGEKVEVDRFSGRVTITGRPTGDTVTGWVAYYKAKNGIERWHYMTNEECDAHAKEYNPGGYGSKKSPWNNSPTNRMKMRRKTCLRIFIKRYGNFSPVMQKFIMSEEAPIDADTSDLPDDVKYRSAPDLKQSAAASVSILSGEGNPDPVTDDTWNDWLSWKERAAKVSYVLPDVDRAVTTENDLRDYLIQIGPEIAEEEQPEQAQLI